MLQILNQKHLGALSLSEDACRTPLTWSGTKITITFKINAVIVRRSLTNATVIVVFYFTTTPQIRFGR